MAGSLNREIWSLAWPNALSNITVPILGMADTAIAGYVGGDVQIGAVSIGTTIFNFIYMNCGFLRMGMTGLTAQAYGAKDERETRRLLTRGLIVAIGITIILMSIKGWLCDFSTQVMGGSAEIQRHVHDYVAMRVYAIPAAVMLFALNGWFIGMQDAKTPMGISIVANIVNISCSAIFALKMEMGIEGIALGTVVAQYVSLAMAIGVYVHRYRPEIARDVRESLDWGGMKKFFAVNRDVMLRNTCIVFAYTMFTRFSAGIGDVELATNALLMQLFTLYSYMFDGVAFAAEALSGKYVGEKNGERFREACRKLFVWGGGISLAYIGIYIACGDQILGIFSPSESTMKCAMENMGYVIAVPLVAFVPYMIDGIMFGATEVGPLRNSMFVSTIAFIGLSYLMIPRYGNDGLWIAFITFTAMRGVLLAWPMKRLYERKLE